MRIVRYSYPSLRTLAPSFGGFPRSPWSGLESEIDRLFESAMGSIAAPIAGRFAVDLFEDKANTYVRAELPGLKREDINVEVTDGILTITAARKTTMPAKGSTEKAEEESEESFSFSRSITLAEDVQTDKISAAYEHGVLTVTLPKRESAQPKKITVSVR
jgi:HSP20 family protein